MNNTLWSTIKSLGIGAVGAALVYLAQHLGAADFGQYQWLAQMIASTLAAVALKYFTPSPVTAQAEDTTSFIGDLIAKDFSKRIENVATDLEYVFKYAKNVHSMVQQLEVARQRKLFDQDKPEDSE